MNLVQVVVEAILGRGCVLAGSATDETRADARLPQDWPRGAVTQGRPHFPRPKVARPPGSVRRGGAGGERTRKGGVGSPPHGPPTLLLLRGLASSSGRSTRALRSPSPQVRGGGGQSTQEGAGEWESSEARGERRAVAKRSTPGAGAVEVEGRESEGAECGGAEAAER